MTLTVEVLETARRCGACQLCCRLLPVPPLGKRGGERCRHQRHGKGCAVYHKAGFPAACGLWNCRWLGNDAGDVSRPDRSHLVIDIMPDFVTVHDGEGGESREEVIQVWIDPKFPDAHRDPAFRAWLEAEDMPALIRFSAMDGFLLVPPARTKDKEWMEIGSAMHEMPHTVAEIVGALGQG